MTGMTDYSAKNWLNYITGQIAMPALPALFLALFTGVGTDAGTGFTEVSTSGTAYARVQVSGSSVTNAATSTSSNILGHASVPAWVVAGMSAYDATNGNEIGTVLSVTSTQVTLTANALHSVASGDTINYSVFGNASGSAPSSTTNGAAVNFAAATGAGFGTCIAWGLYDASTGGNLLTWDFMGQYAWLPFEMASGGNLATVKANGMANNDPVVFTAEYGGTLPTLSTGTFTGYTINYVATPATDTINVDTTSGPSVPVVSTSSGSGFVRKIVQQSIPAGVSATFSAATMTLMSA